MGIIIDFWKKALKGKLVNDKVNISMEFYPTNLTGQGQKQSNAQKESTLVQDWICDKVFL